MAKIEHWQTSVLREYEGNARTHSPAQIQKIAGSIKRFGFNNPIIVDGRTRTILAGHGRLAAAKALQMDTVPVLPVDHMSELERRAYVLADNRLAEESYWDRTLLASELDDLEGAGVIEAIGFDDSQLSAMLGNNSVLSDPDDEPEPEASQASAPVPEHSDQLKPIDRVTIRIGEIRMLVTAEQYIEWRAKLREEVGLNMADAIDAICQKVGLC